MLRVALSLLFIVVAVVSIAESASFMLARASRTFAVSRLAPVITSSSTLLSMSSERKAGVASPEELRNFVQKAGDRLVVIDVRNPDATAEPGDQKSLAVAPLPSNEQRPNALHLIWDRNANTMPLPDISKDTPIITHCGGGGRGQKAKGFLEKNGFTNVVNGGGPKETECWNEFGDK